MFEYLTENSVEVLLSFFVTDHICAVWIAFEQKPKMVVVVNWLFTSITSLVDSKILMDYVVVQYHGMKHKIDSCYLSTLLNLIKLI